MIDRKLKILLTVHCFFPRHYHGTERYTLELAKSLQDMGHDVVVLTTNIHPEDSVGEDYAEYSFEGIRVISIDLVHLGELPLRFTYERPQINPIFRRILWQEKPDLLHCCHLLYLGGTLIAEAKKARLPVICTLTDFFCICWTNRLVTLKGKACKGPKYFGMNCVADFYGHQLWSTRMARYLFERGMRNFVGKLKRVVKEKSNLPSGSRFPVADIQLRKERIYEYCKDADKFLVATDFLREAYIRNGYSSDRFTKLTFGISQPSEEEKSALERRYMPSEHGSPFVLGFIGQIAHHKGIDLLVKSFQKAHLPDAELHIYGDLEQEEETKRFILSACAKDSRIRCLGTFPGKEIYERLASIHALCIPSIWAENAPLVLLNALASKTLVIISDGKGLAEFVRDGSNGIVFKNGNLKDLVRVLRQAYDEREEWRGKLLAEVGYTFTPADYAFRVHQIYTELLDDHIRPSFIETEPAVPPILSIRKLQCRSNLACDSAPGGTILGPDKLVQSLCVEQPQLPLEYRVTGGQVSILLSQLSGFGNAHRLKGRIRFNQAGLTVFYYTLNSDDSFSADQKFTRYVAADTDYDLELKLYNSGKHMCQLRWDVLCGVQDCLLTLYDFQLR
jgi:glycosyltransferase involved in cell wall biosynthesis